MGGTVVGVDIGSVGVRAVEVSGFDTARPTIVRQHEVPLPVGSVQRGEVIEVSTVASALKRLWTTGGFKSKEVVLGIGGQRVFARDVSVPRAPLQQIRESLPFQVQDLLPVPVGDALLDFYPIADAGTGEAGPMVSGLLVAALKDAVNANVSAVMQAGLRPVHVDLIPFAMVRALAPRGTSGGRDVVVSLGANTTNVAVTIEGVPHFVRIIPNGGDDVTRALAQRLQISPEQAEQYKRAIGMGGPLARQEDRPIVEIVYEVVGELLNSIRTTLSYYATAHPNEPVQRIVLSGGGAQLNGLSNALSEMTRLPVTLADPFAAGQTAKTAKRLPRDQQDAFTTAYGLALGSHA